MNRFYFFIFFILSLSLNPIFASEDDRQGLDERDIEALRDWINTKRQVTIKERGGNLSISGEVRAELQSTNEKKGGIKQCGSGGAPSSGWNNTSRKTSEQMSCLTRFSPTLAPMSAPMLFRALLTTTAYVLLFGFKCARRGCRE